MNAELTTALKMFSCFFDNINQSLVIIDEQGCYVYYNKEGVRVDGCPAEQALGRHILEVHPELTEQSSTMLQALRHGKSYFGGYQTYINAAGKVVDYLHTTSPLKSNSGKIIGAIEIGNDISTLRRMQTQIIDLYASGGESLDDVDIITSNKTMRDLIQTARKLASTNIPVLIYGETGTGKELFAKLVHRNSTQAKQPFVVVDCAALPETLIESSLFGTARGAFTGAENRRGFLDAAQGGTLFLDEINSLPLHLQGKLLRVIQNGTFCRVGSHQEIKANVRIISATNESPQELLKNSHIRLDLLHRINMGYLAIPPLRERLDDIEELSLHFINKHRETLKTPIHEISRHALEQLKSATWAGNVRMLENVIVRSLILQQGNTHSALENITIDEDYIGVPAAASIQPHEDSKIPPKQSLKNESTLPLDARLAAFEKSVILEHLQNGDSLRKVAQTLGIPRTTLQYKIKKYGIILARTVKE